MFIQELAATKNYLAVGLADSSCVPLQRSVQPSTLACKMSSDKLLEERSKRRFPASELVDALPHI